MISIAWATDIHLEHAGPEAALAFIERVRASGAASLLLGGDISTAVDIKEQLTDLAGLIGMKVRFVLGNHDYYGGSVSQVRQDMANLDVPDLHWLAATGPLELAPGIALVGHGGWGDTLVGNFAGSDVFLSDYVAIAELRRAIDLMDFKGIFGPDSPLEKELRALGREAAETLRPQLQEAARSSRHVIILTHVPPFRGASWHEGKISGETWLPGFCCGSLGEVIQAAAQTHPECLFTVLCGHTHGEGTARLAENLVAHTQAAEYGRPGFVMLRVDQAGVEILKKG